MRSSSIRASLARIPTGGVYSQEDLEKGKQLLVRCRLLRGNGGLLQPDRVLLDVVDMPEEPAKEALLSLVLGRCPPLWISTAVAGLSLYEELIPDAELSAVSEVLTTPDRREAFLLALGRRHDSTALEERGAAGEEYVAELCRNELARLGRSELAPQVQRVSEVSDQLGYDVVTPIVTGGVWRLEVKTTQVRDAVRVVITRNEAVTGIHDPHWALVVCRVRGDDSHDLVGWCRAQVLAPLLPRDAQTGGRWLTASIEIDEELLQPGLPGLSED